MVAQYVPVDDRTLTELLTLGDDALYDRYVELEDALYGTAGHYDMDVLWDGLHFLLTGASAWHPIADDPLSEAIVGVHEVCADPWLSCLRSEELVLRVAALRAVDLDGMLRAVDFQTFADRGVYPAIWTGDPARLKADLAARFHGLLTAYEALLGTGEHVLVQIG